MSETITIEVEVEDYDEYKIPHLAPAVRDSVYEKLIDNPMFSVSGVTATSDEHFPEPSDWIEEKFPGDLDRGVARDVLVEAMVNGQHDVHKARNLRVELDAMADHLGRYPPEVEREMRSIQQDLDDLHVWLERYEETIKTMFRDESLEAED